ncbi:MAG: UDP-N-acetylglucosamine--N-acetylmuramyl-(pentapeptide) pyrophosphoryl-undecaprenol N-acetylglucosamine transferase [Planctomycetota bacterium]
MEPSLPWIRRIPLPPTTALPTDSHASSPRASSPSSSRADPDSPRSIRADEPAPTELRLAVAGGGTGGHLVPGINVCLQARAADPPSLAGVVWLSSGRSIEERILGGLEARISPVALGRAVLALEPTGGGAPSRAGLVWRTAPAVMAARRVLVDHGSNVLLGLGGFACLPAVLAARSLGLPVALLEMNAACGSATRWLTPFARRVFHSWRGTLPPRDPAAKDEDEDPVHVFVGPPLAPEFDGREITATEQSRARAELGFAPDRPLLVVLGGSQGATGLNHFVRTYAPALVASGVQVLHQTGPGKMDEGCEPFSGYLAVEFVAPVHRALAAATAVLCRGGASTLAEVAAIGRPAVVVPYPHHADQHQEKNALELGEGVRVVREDKLSASLRADLERLCSPQGDSERQRMTRALRSAVPIDGAQRVATDLLSLARPAAIRRAGRLP